MKIQADNLSSQLQTTLLPVYVLSGDEPLLITEAADAIRAQARQQGFTEREVFFVERGGSSWADVLRAAEALSLFAAKRIVEVRMPSGKPGTGAADLLRMIQVAGDDLLLLVVTGRLDASARDAEWLGAAERRGGTVTVWPVDLPRFPAWLQARFRAAGLAIDDEALALLVERTEGNLLAARQEVDKLRLLFGAGARVDVAAVAASAGESARFDVLQLTRSVEAGQAARALRVLDGLHTEGTEAVLVLWALLRAKSELQAPRGGAPRRLPFARLTVRASRADRMAKGQMRGNVWDELSLLTAELCGQQVLPLERWQMRMQGSS